MREIWFRGKTYDGKWEQGDLRHGGYVHNDSQTYIMRSDYALHNIPVDPKTVGQYTGLTDTNCKKIFGGDIVKFGKYLYQIIFVNGSFALYDEQGLMIEKIGGINDHCYSLMNLYLECCWENNWAYDIEVIGNITDNPELLKGGAE